MIGTKGGITQQFVIIDDNQRFDILPLKAQYMNPPSSEPPKKRQCKMNTTPRFDEYVVDNSEDDLDKDNHSLDEPDEDDETSEAFIKAFSYHNYQALEEDIQLVAQSQCLSQRGFQHDKFHFKKQDVKTVTSCGPNTRLFSLGLPND